MKFDKFDGISKFRQSYTIELMYELYWINASINKL